MLSHELRNPLAPIANAASVLRTLEHSNPILVRLREILDRQVGRLSRLVEELIDVTRAAQGQISLVRERVFVDGIVQSAVAQSHDKLNAGKHRLEVDVPDQRLQVRGDPGRLAQALANLIGNAAKFTLRARRREDRRAQRRQDRADRRHRPGPGDRSGFPAARLRALRAAGPDARPARWADSASA